MTPHDDDQGLPSGLRSALWAGADGRRLRAALARMTRMTPGDRRSCEKLFEAASLCGHLQYHAHQGLPGVGDEVLTDDPRPTRKIIVGVKPQGWREPFFGTDRRGRPIRTAPLDEALVWIASADGEGFGQTRLSSVRLVRRAA